MALNSLDIQNVVFSSEIRGYDKNDVDDFLDLLIRDYDTFAEQIKDQDQELKNLHGRVAYFEEIQDSLNKSIVVAHSAAENLKQQTNSEVAGIKSEADSKVRNTLDAASKEAREILDSALGDAKQIAKETNDLKRTMRAYHQRIVEMLETQLSHIKTGEWKDILKSTTSFGSDENEEDEEEQLEPTVNPHPFNENTERVDPVVQTQQEADAFIQYQLIKENETSTEF